MTKSTKTKSKIRYRLYVMDPATKKEHVALQATKLKKLTHDLAINVYVNPHYYDFEKGKRAKLRLVCERVEGKKISVLEEYTINKKWQIKGFIMEWESLDKKS